MQIAVLKILLKVVQPLRPHYMQEGLDEGGRGKPHVAS